LNPDFSPASFKARRTVWVLQSTLVMSLSCRASWAALSALPEVIMRTSLRLSVAVSLAGRPPLLFCTPGLALARTLFTVIWLTPSCASTSRDERPLSMSERMLLRVSSEMRLMARGGV
jgi:hypothetical protein